MPRKCFCGMRIRPNGTCENTCSRWAEPGHLRAQERKRQANDAHRRREERIFITQDDIRAMRRAMRKLDPIYAAAARRGRKAAAKRYAMGGAK